MLEISERWPSGRRRTPGKCVGGKPSPGFESLSLRHIPNFLASLDLEKKVTHKEDNERVSNYKIRGRKDTIDLVKIC